MIDESTILSLYDGKATLLQWLKKVEEALKGASAVSFKVNKRGDATLTFSVVFEDGSELETAPIILQQGESVQAATIRNSHLILTLTNGDELDAGDLGGVSGFSIDASQHLIVTYQSGRTQDLGAIFSGNVVINGNFEVTGLATLPNIEGDENGNINVDGDIVISDGGISIADGAVSTPILTSQNDNIEAQKPVVEVMTGYSFAKENVEEWAPIYIGACKNGNKITFTIYARVAKTSAFAATHLRLGIFYIPSVIGNKLVPDANNNLDYRRKEFMTGATDTSPIEATLQTEKITNSSFSVQIRNFNNFVEGESRIFRYEITFLLSDNLAA